MNCWQLLNSLRDINASIRRLANDDLWSVKDICEILGTPMPAGLDPTQKFSMICCFDGVFLKHCLYVLYEYGTDKNAEHAMKNGATAILSAKQIGSYPCIVVPDVKAALRILCSHMYNKIAVPTTVVTGSIGKTTTKNFINCVYSSQYRTFCNTTNGNTFEYLGFELQRFDRNAQCFVQEVNESDPANTSNCSLVLRPQIAAITNMDKSHIGELGSEENIMKAICEITDGMDDKGIVLINADDPNSMKVSFRQQVITVAIKNRNADCLAENIVEGYDYTEFDLIYEGRSIHIRLPISGIHNIYNAQMAYIAGRLNNISDDKIVKGLQRFRSFGFRQNIYKVGNQTIYADCYNASDRSIQSALAVLDRQLCRYKGRRVAILGDIAEIEGFEKETYQAVASSVNDSKLDVLITFGPCSRMIHEFLNRDGIIAFHADSREMLHSYIRNNTGTNDAILFKASRSMRLEQTIKAVFPLAYFKGMLPFWLRYIKWTIKTL